MQAALPLIIAHNFIMMLDYRKGRPTPPKTHLIELIITCYNPEYEVGTRTKKRG